MISSTDTIAAIATPQGMGGIAIVRISGNDAIRYVNNAWRGRDLTHIPPRHATLGKYVALDGGILDECVATVFHAPASFTGEDVVELAIHGSPWIQKEILKDLINRGVRNAGPGEFSQRAFLNSRIDLTQAEGIADLISASSKASHDLALKQVNGSFSEELDSLRSKMIDFASLLELELDFSEEDVTFADRGNLISLASEIRDKTRRLADTFSSGSAFKEGVPTVIAGIPNAGKSSLLNLIACEEKAIVTDVAGTTRDTIETTAEINGIMFRFIDTAGLRETTDTVEVIGIQRAQERMRKARIVIWMIDCTQPIDSQTALKDEFVKENPAIEILTLFNKSDLASADAVDGISFSTKTEEGLDILKRELSTIATKDYNPDTELIVTNARHYESLLRTTESLDRAIESLKTGIPTDLIVQDIREAMHHLGTITGAVTPADLLHNIFSRFCIGK